MASATTGGVLTDGTQDIPGAKSFLSSLAAYGGGVAGVTVYDDTIDNIIGVKEASGKLEQFNAVMSHRRVAHASVMI